MNHAVSEGSGQDRLLFEGRLALQQRVLPGYRARFFEALGSRCRAGLALFAGQPLAQEAIPPAERLTGVDLTWGQNQHFFHPRHSLYLCRQSGLLDWLEAADPAALIVEANPRYLSTPAAIRWMRERRRLVLGWGLGAPSLSGPLQRLRDKARRNLLASLDGIIAYSRRGAQEYAGLEILPPSRIFSAENAVSPPPDQPPPARKRQPGQLIRLLFVGRLQARKNLQLLFQACAMLDQSLRPSLTIVGDGPARGDFERTARASVPDTHFLGALHGEALADAFRQADLFVLPGTGGLAVQEAMSHALPVIVARGDGTQEDLVRPDNGWLVEADSLEALTAALQMALADPDRLGKMGLESYRIVREEINIERMADKMVAALNEISKPFLDRA
jgi:glycosyltransferase involved in cell wall biosynthesis